MKNVIFTRYLIAGKKKNILKKYIFFGSKILYEVDIKISLYI